MLSAFVTLLKSLPEILLLIKQIQDAIKANELDHTVKSGVGIINDAFKNKDASALDALFSGAAPPVVPNPTDVNKV